MATIYDLEQEVAALKILVSALQTDVTTLENTDVTHNTEFTGIKSRVAAVETIGSANQTNIATLQTGASNTQMTIAAIQTTISSIQSTIADLPTDMDELTETVAQIDTELTALQSSVAGLQSSIGGMQSTVGAVQIAQNNADGKIAALEIGADAIETQYAAQQIEINALKAQDVATTAQVTQHAAALAQLTTSSGDSGWQNIPLNHDWGMTQYADEVPQYRKVGNRVTLRGLVTCTAAAGGTIGILPEGFRPSRGSFNRFCCSMNRAEFINIQIGTNGGILDYTRTSGTIRNLVSLNGISFLVD